MKRTNKNLLPEIINEIITTEQARARKLMNNSVFRKWVTGFRQKYIVNGFLMPLYALDGKYSISRHRVDKYGSNILPEENEGEVFHEPSQSRLRNEQTRFWFYLTEGQEVFNWRFSIPEPCRIDGIPANPVWREIVEVIKELHLNGESGGGIFMTPKHIDEDFLAGNVQSYNEYEDEDGYLESHSQEDNPHWITMFHRYERYEVSNQEIEIRPAWFHLANYAFFNILVQRLPIFSCVFTEEGRVEKVHFLENSLSDQARDYIGNALLDIPIKLKQQAEIDTPRREREEMTWRFGGMSAMVNASERSPMVR